jgi:hypothetical protein
MKTPTMIQPISFTFISGRKAGKKLLVKVTSTTAAWFLKTKMVDCQREECQTQVRRLVQVLVVIPRLCRVSQLPVKLNSVTFNGLNHSHLGPNILIR